MRNLCLQQDHYADSQLKLLLRTCTWWLLCIAFNMVNPAQALFTSPEQINRANTVAQLLRK